MKINMDDSIICKPSGNPSKSSGGGIGMPTSLYLHEFGSKVWGAFGSVPYHVGSSLTGMLWRDVDIRLILSDEDYEKEGYGNPGEEHENEKWVAMCMAFSELGRKMTGLPIDFQIQQMTDANKRYSGNRGAIGLIPIRYKKLRASKKD